LPARPIKLARKPAMNRMDALSPVSAHCLSVAVERAPEVDIRIGDQAIMGALEAGEHAVDLMGDVDLRLAALMVAARELDARGVRQGGRIRLQGEGDQMAVGIH